MPARTRDEGVALIAVLIFLTVFSILVVALLGLSSTGLRQVNTVQAQRIGMATSEGAVRAAMNHARSHFQANHPTIVTDPASWSWCTDSAFSLTGNGKTASVRCSVRGSSVVGDTLGKPPWGIQTLGGAAITQKKPGTTTVEGGIASSGSIDVRSGGTLSVVGDVRAVSGTCSGVVATGTKVCPSGASPADPGYGPVLSTAPTTVASVPTTCTGPIIEFAAPPGGLVFDDAGKLNALTDGVGGDGCTGKILWFKPGVYRFAFADHGSHRWRLKDGGMTVIAGAAQGGWDTDPDPQPALPGSCIDTPSTWGTDGVQFVFGGDSRLEVSNGAIELCGRQGGVGGQRIAIYGPSTTSNGYVRQTSTILKTTEKGTTIVHGSLYSPTGSVDLRDTSVYATTIDRGIIARGVELRVSNFQGPLVRIPGSVPEATVTVDLFGRVDGREWIHALVTYSRRSGSYYMTISEWDVLR